MNDDWSSDPDTRADLWAVAVSGAHPDGLGFRTLMLFRDVGDEVAARALGIESCLRRHADDDGPPAIHSAIALPIPRESLADEDGEESRDFLEKGALTFGMTEDGDVGCWRDGKILGYGDTLFEAYMEARRNG